MQKQTWQLITMTRTALFIAAVLFCGSSIICSIKLGWHEQETEFDKWLIVSIFLAVEICKYTFFPLAQQQLKNSKYWSAGLGLIASVLLLISIVATVAFFETGAANSISTARMSSNAYQSAQKDLNGLESQIESILRAQSTFSKKENFGTATTKQNATLSELRMKRDAALQRLNSVTVIPESGLHSIFNKAAELLNLSVSSIRLTTYLLAAIIIDVCGIMCLMQLTMTSSSETETVTSPKKQHVTAVATVKRNAAEINETLKQEIAAGDYGDKPVMRKIIRETGVRHPAVKLIFDSLIDDGKLKRSGNGFELVRVES